MTHQELSPTIHVLPTAMEKERVHKLQPGQLGGWRLAAARVAWFTLLAVSVIYFVSGMPTSYSIANTLNADTIAGLSLADILLALGSIALLAGLYFSYLQVAVIGAICFWCVVAALLDLGIWLAALQNWRASRRAQADATH